MKFYICKSQRNQHLHQEIEHLQPPQEVPPPPAIDLPGGGAGSPAPARTCQRAPGTESCHLPELRGTGSMTALAPSAKDKCLLCNRIHPEICFHFNRPPGHQIQQAETAQGMQVNLKMSCVPESSLTTAMWRSCWWKWCTIFSFFLSFLVTFGHPIEYGAPEPGSTSEPQSQPKRSCRTARSRTHRARPGIKPLSHWLPRCCWSQCTTAEAPKMVYV